MTTKDQQLAFANGFGVIPSIQSAEADYLAANSRTTQPFVDGVEYARGVVTAPGITDVLADFDAQLDGLATSDPKTILESVQQNLTDAIGELIRGRPSASPSGRGSRASSSAVDRMPARDRRSRSTCRHRHGGVEPAGRTPTRRTPVEQAAAAGTATAWPAGCSWPRRSSSS